MRGKLIVRVNNVPFRCAFGVKFKGNYFSLFMLESNNQSSRSRTIEILIIKKKTELDSLTYEREPFANTLLRPSLFYPWSFVFNGQLKNAFVLYSK